MLDTYIEKILGFSIPGLGILVILIAVTLVGILGSTLIFKPFVFVIDKAVKRAPLINLIYTSIKDFMNAFVGKEKRFNKPVLVEMYPGTGLQKLGFITNEDLTNIGIPKGRIAVYLPHSYNFSGNLFFVPSDRVTPVDMPASEAMKFIISAGITNV